MRSLAKKILLGLAALLVLSPCVWDRLASQEKISDYVGSEKCAVCHRREHTLWKSSLHSKMYQKSDQAGVILGDFSRADPVRTFRKEEVAYTIGSRWEQMYVTRRNGEEYLLPAKWLIAQKKWAPLDDTHRRNEPMSKTCHGCHTTAWNPQAQRYAEMNIGCEACHGPGGQHVTDPGKGTIRRSQNPEVCGQCHTRGKSSEGLDYVVKFDPQTDRLADKMAFTRPEQGTTRSWWSNRVERDRHQEYLGYLQSGHARSLEHLRQRAKAHPEEVRPECFACHSSEYHRAKDRSRIDAASLQYGVTCIQCHDPHGRGDQVEAASVSKTEDTSCRACHFVPGVKSHLSDAHHYPCPENVARCIDCHMPVTGLSAATFNIRSHTLRIITPQEAQVLGMPSSCNNASCHGGKDFGWLKNAYDKFYQGRSFARAK
jgi:hypothetical protein